MERASKIIEKYRGRYTKIERLKNIILGVLMAVFLIVAISVGVAMENYVWALFIILIYLVIVFIAFYWIRYISSKFFRDA